MQTWWNRFSYLEYRDPVVVCVTVVGVRGREEGRGAAFTRPLASLLLQPRSPAPVAGPIVIAVASLGVVINTLTALLFLKGQSDANVRGAFLHMAADAAVSLGVVLAGAAIALTGATWIDPVTSLVVAAVIVAGTWGLFRESLDLALDAVPRGVEPEAIEAALTALPGVREVHDLHVWGASTSEVSLTVHLVVVDGTDHDRLLADAEAVLRERFRVAHSTIQIEGPAACEQCRQRPADVL